MYEAMFDEVCRLCEEHGVVLGTERSQDLVRAYWKIGRRIVDHEQGGARRADFGDTVARRLARDLQQRYGKGFSVSQVCAFRKFACLWDEEDLAEPLLWSHYRALLPLKDSDVRRNLERRIRSEDMGRREIALEVQRLEGLQAGGARAGTPGARASLTLRPGRYGLFRLEAGPGGEGSWVLDAGFGIKVALPLGTAVGDCLPGQVVGLAERGLLAAECLAGDWERYCYRGLVRRVVDGDTLVLRVDLGLEAAGRDGLGYEFRARLRGLDAAEAGSPDGQAAWELLASLLPEGTAVRVQTHGQDAYGRWMVDVAGDCFVNNALLEAGLAARLR